MSAFQLLLNTQLQKGNYKMLKIVGWAMGAIAIYLVGMFFDKGEFMAGMLCVFSVGLFIPPIIEKLNNNAREKAEQNGKPHKDLSLKSSIIGGVLLLAFAGYIGSDDQPQAKQKTKTVKTQKTNTTESKKTKPIDLIYQLKTKMDELEYWYKGPFKPTDKLKFYEVKTKYDKQLNIICEEFGDLVKRTGNLNSEYHDENLTCLNFQLSLVHVIQNLNHGTYNEIPKLREKLEHDYQNLKIQVDEEIRRINTN
jgi:hypothetical protein